MKVIIDIPDNIYDAIKKAQTIISGQRSGKTLLQILVNNVENGTPLPKGHGRLGDLDALKKEVLSWGMNDYEPSDFIDEIDRADVIIEAESEDKE